MSDLPWMPIYWTDHLVATSHLTAEQFGAYTRILGHMWIAGDGTLPNNQSMLARISGVHPPHWKRTWSAIAPLFTEEGDRITQKRLLAEWRNAVTKQARRRAAGSLGGQTTALSRLKTRPLDHSKSAPKALKNNKPPPSDAAHNYNYKEKKQQSAASPLPCGGKASAAREEKTQSEKSAARPNGSAGNDRDFTENTALAASLRSWGDR